MWVREQWVQGGDSGKTGAMMDVKTFACITHLGRSRRAGYLKSHRKVISCLEAMQSSQQFVLEQAVSKLFLLASGEDRTQVCGWETFSLYHKSYGHPDL